jgi:DNA repair exonuclease SbcCD ATPase subunit
MLSNVLLDIKNFKSIESKKFNLANGMTLIKGPSGVGKSTIIESISYAITGKPKTCKPLGTSCSTKVSLSFLLKDQEWEIIRSTRPGRLVVTRSGAKQVEDDEAQSLISTVFGKNFDIISYIPQDTSRSFAKMKPAEKLSFMEQISIGSEVSTLKSKAKTYLSEMKRNANASCAKHSLRADDLKKLQKVDTPKKLLPTRPSVRDIDEVRKEKNLIKSKIRETKLRLEEVEKEKKSIEQTRSSRHANKLRVKSLDKDINESCKELEVENISEVEDVMNNKVEGWEEENKKWMKNKNKELKDVKDSIKVAETKDIVFFKCPSCDDDIGYNCLTSEAVLPETVPNIETTETYSIRDLMRKESKINRELSERKNKVKEANRLKELIANLTEEWGEDSLDDINELEETYAMTKELNKLVHKRDRILSTLKEEDEDFSDDKVDELESIINEEKAKLDTANDEFDRIDRLLSDIEQWSRETEQVRRYNENIDRAKKVYEEAVEKERLAAIDKDNTSKLLKGAEEFKSAVQEAESLALVNQVNCLNDHASTYLDSIFVEDPIEVSLKTFSETKSSGKIKPSIKTEIQYKGNEMSLNALSGGEQARVVIAYTLALGDIMGSSIIMLDEVTANLEMTEIIFETVKSNTKNKIVVAVAHQCVDGIFDNIINF